MIVTAGEKLHLIYRAIYENSTRRHFLGQVVAAEAALCRIEGYAYIYDTQLGSYTRRPELRTTIADLGDSGYIVNMMDPGVDLDAVIYKYIGGVGLVVTDGKDFTLNINEFSTRS